MNTYQFVIQENPNFIRLDSLQKTSFNKTPKPQIKISILVILLVFLLGGIVYFENRTNTSEELEMLIQKAVNNENLSAQQWSKLCELLATEKQMDIKDCENCHEYIRALLGGKHKKHLENYQKRTDKEIEKGINSYRKQVELHQEKIKHPEKFYPNWDNLDQRFKNDLITEKWNDDIQRNSEQKRLLECILKNR